MKMMKTILVVGLLVLSVTAFASMAFMKTFTDTYKKKIPANSALAKASCMTCHMTQMPKLNPYGTDVKKVLGKSKKLTPPMLAKVEKLDSDKDKASNIKEIKKGTLPGDPRSK